MLEEKNIRTTTGTIDVSVGDSRVKLGTNGYSSMAHAEGVLAEGSFTCDTDGNAAFTWEHCINFDKASGEWIAPGDKSVLPTAFGLADGESYLIYNFNEKHSITRRYAKRCLSNVHITLSSALYLLQLRSQCPTCW